MSALKVCVGDLVRWRTQIYEAKALLFKVGRVHSTSEYPSAQLGANGYGLKVELPKELSAPLKEAITLIDEILSKTDVKVELVTESPHPD